MSKGEKVQLRVAAIGASATLAAAAIGAGVQLQDDSPEVSASVDCAAIVARIVEIAKQDPKVAQLYARNIAGLPALVNQHEAETCGDPHSLLVLLARETN